MKTFFKKLNPFLKVVIFHTFFSYFIIWCYLHLNNDILFNTFFCYYPRLNFNQKAIMKGLLIVIRCVLHVVYLKYLISDDLNFILFILLCLKGEFLLSCTGMWYRVLSALIFFREWFIFFSESFYFDYFGLDSS